MKKLILPILGLLFILAACTPVETGTISLVSPAKGITYHDDSGIAQVVVHSSFADTKIAAISLNGAQVFICTLTGNADTTCPSVALPKPGVHDIAITTYRTNGEAVTAQTTANWSPYTELDKLAQSLAGGEGKSLGIGYTWLTFIVVALTTITFLALGAGLTHGSTNGLTVGAVLGIFIGLVGMGFYVLANASPEIGVMVISSIIAVIIAALIVLVRITAIKHGHSSTIVIGKSLVTLPDGTRNEKIAGQLYAGPSKDGPNRNSEAFREDYARLLEERRLKQLPDTENW